ncbi:hypothetical protein JWF52_14765 [Clostridium sp. CCUG 7971]|nr:hypothetical protein [Clostridium sp. CCUG 7971]
MTEIGKSLIEEGLEKGKKEGIEEGERKKAMEIAKSLLDVLSIKMIAEKISKIKWRALPSIFILLRSMGAKLC